MYWSSMFYLFGRKLYLIQIVKFMVTFQYNITTDSIKMDIGIVVFGFKDHLVFLLQICYHLFHYH